MRLHRLVLLAAASVAVAGIAAPAAQAMPADPGCSITTTGGLSPGVTSFSITFTKTCGYYVRTFIHYNDVPNGTYWDYGNAVEGTYVTSSQLLNLSDRTYCSYGWQYEYGSTWETESTGGSGC